MGGVQSANDGREINQTSEGESAHTSQQTSPTAIVPECVAAMKKTDDELHADTTNVPHAADPGRNDADETVRSAHDDNDGDAADDSDDSMTEKCRARKMTAELAEFRRNLQQKRQLHQSKLGAVKDELEHLRQALAEEKRRNRALIKYVQQQEEQRQLTKQTSDGERVASDAATCAVRHEALQIVARSAESTGAGLELAERVNAEAEDEPHGELSSSAGGQTSAEAHEERLALKRELAESQHALQCTTGELLELRHELAQLRTQLRAQQDETEAESSRQCSTARTLKAELAETQFRLQISQAEALSLQTDVDQLRNQVKSLKDVIKAGKEIIAIREDQVEQLKGKLRQIEDTLQERELQIMSDDLRREYDRQLTNIRNLRDLYEERERVSRMERDNLVRQLDLKKNELATEQEKNKNLEALVESLQTDLTRLRTELEQTEEKLSQSKAESKQLQLEMGVVNQFISKFLLGMARKPTASDINIDKLAAVLEENRDLLIEMTKDEAETLDTGAFLPRALYDLIREVDEANEPTGGEEDGAEASGEDEFTDVQKASPEQIADKLPKVWRVLIELVNHQERAQPVPFVEGGESEECLKSEQTRNGPKTVVSVSKTYIKLKDLILEKKSLKKETNRLRTLNSHLERRLDSQEKRLSAVSLELTKTWHLVGKMQRQHRQLHTQEQILRYHLQQKRRLLSELKEELEYCRLKWSAAREKNIESEGQWKSLKADFAARRKQDSLNNSGESGYSDEQPSDEDETHVNRKSSLANQQSVGYSGGCSGLNMESDKWSQMVGRLDKCFVGSSLSNIYHLAVASVLRRAHSESDMKSLENVERANRFCNEKIEDLPIFPFEEDEAGPEEEVEEIPVALRKKRKSASKKGKKRHNDAGQPESAQDMFLRLMNLAEDGQEVVDDDDEDGDDDGEEQDFERTGTGNDNAEGEYSENESASELSEEELECLEMAVMDERAESSVTQERLEGGCPDASPSQFDANAEELSSEELFQRKREARLQRMAELNSRLDRYSSPTPVSSSEAPHETSSEEDGECSQVKTAEQVVLSEDEQKYLQRRAERLERLEREAKEFRSRLSKTVHRGTEISAQIDEIHNGFMARQSESSPVPGCSGEGGQQASRVDLSCLTDKEREYTSTRAERLERLENESQKLLKQMNQTMRRGSSLTTKLDMLHTRYGGSPAANEPEANVESSGPEQQPVPEESSSSEPVEELQENVPEREEQVYTVDGGGPYLPMGPIELVLVSDEEVMDEVSNLLEGENASQQNTQDSNGRSEQS